MKVKINVCQGIKMQNKTSYGIILKINVCQGAKMKFSLHYIYICLEIPSIFLYCQLLYYLLDDQLACKIQFLDCSGDFEACLKPFGSCCGSVVVFFMLAKSG